MATISENEMSAAWESLLQALVDLEGAVDGVESREWEDILHLSRALDVACRAFFDQYDVKDEQVAGLIGGEAASVMERIERVAKLAAIDRQKILQEGSGVVKGKKVVQAYKKV